MDLATHVPCGIDWGQELGEGTLLDAGCNEKHYGDDQ
jgi:hypothetical protein